jgi:hypothetical protein
LSKGDSTEIEHSTRYPNIEGSKPAAGTGKEKMAKKFNVHLSKGDSTVVDFSTPCLKIEDSKPATGTKKEKYSKKLNVHLCKGRTLNLLAKD